jgi:hypothetical protein
LQKEKSKIEDSLQNKALFRKFPKISAIQNASSESLGIAGKFHNPDRHNSEEKDLYHHKDDKCRFIYI